MKRINRPNTTIIEFKGVHPRAVFGLILTAFLGVPMLIFSLMIHQYNVENGSLMIAGMGVVICLVILVACLRMRVKCDLNRGQVMVETQVLFVPIRSRVYSEGGASQVLIERQLHRNKNSTYYSYPVSLVTAQDTVTLSNVRDALLPRTLGEACAKALKVTMVDHSTGAEVSREWDELDMSLRERAEKHGETPSVMDLAEPVGQFKGNARLNGTDLEVTMPLPMWMKFKKFIPVVALFPLIPFGIIFFVMSSRGKGAPVLIILPFVFFAVIVGVVVMVTVGKIGHGLTFLKATPDTLVLDLGPQKVTLKAGAIEELTMCPPVNPLGVLGMYGGSISIRTDTAIHVFGQNLSGDELEWLHTTLFAILAG